MDKAKASLFSKLRHELESYLEADDIELCYQAFLVAHEAHQGQKRQTGEPYIVHPVAVGRILALMHMDAASVMAALLHDVLEDTPVDKEALSSKFGEEVTNLVDGVSKLTQMQFETRAHAQAENFRKMALAMVRDIRVIIIKIADRLHNMRTLYALPRSKQYRISTETLEIYAPIANRLGMHEFRIELEDLGFSYLYPMRYRVIKRAVENLVDEREKIMHEIESKLKSCLLEKQIPLIESKWRVKHPYGIYRKMRAKHLSFSEVMDVYAFRIIVNSIDTCYRVLGAVHQLYKPVPERFKDYIAIPKANGYQSLHTILFGPKGVPLEIQIRTEKMDKIAETGVAAHWRYKTLPHEMAVNPKTRAQEWLKKVMEMQTRTGSSMEFIEDVKVDLFPDEVYVFTPMGTILELPNGATAVDFAYAIHSDIGNTCVAAKIDRRLATLSTKLFNGQSVEIITAPGAIPNPAWLNFVVTAKARSNIRHFMKSRKRAESIKLGRRLLERALGDKKIDDIAEMMIYNALRETKYNTLDDLLEAIGLGNQVAELVVHRLLTDEEAIGQIKKQESKEEAIEEVKPIEPLMIKGSEGMVVSFAECCRPVPGDMIKGILERGKGLVVHEDQCFNLLKYNKHPEKLIPVFWESRIKGEFPVDITIEVANQRGVLAELAAAVSSAEANIENINVKQGDGQYYYIYLSIKVRNRVHLAQVIRRIRKIKMAGRITRGRQMLA